MFKSIVEYFSHGRECIRLRQQVVDIMDRFVKMEAKYKKELEEKDSYINSLSSQLNGFREENNRVYQELNRIKLLTKYEEE